MQKRCAPDNLLILLLHHKLLSLVYMTHTEFGEPAYGFPALFWVRFYHSLLTIFCLIVKPYF
jgi:hypothetical protein